MVSFKVRKGSRIMGSACSGSLTIPKVCTLVSSIMIFIPLRHLAIWAKWKSYAVAVLTSIKQEQQLDKHVSSLRVEAWHAMQPCRKGIESLRKHAFDSHIFQFSSALLTDMHINAVFLFIFYIPGIYAYVSLASLVALLMASICFLGPAGFSRFDLCFHWDSRPMRCHQATYRPLTARNGNIRKCKWNLMFGICSDPWFKTLVKWNCIIEQVLWDIGLLVGWLHSCFMCVNGEGHWWFASAKLQGFLRNLKTPGGSMLPELAWTTLNF